MRRILFGIFVGVFVLPILCESYASIKASIEKRHGCVESNEGANVHKSDSVAIGYNDMTSTIRITTIAERKTVKIEIYKEGGLIYADKDDVMNSSSLDYTLTDEETGEYDVCVTTDDGTTIGGTIVKE